MEIGVVADHPRLPNPFDAICFDAPGQMFPEILHEDARVRILLRLHMYQR